MQTFAFGLRIDCRGRPNLDTWQRLTSWDSYLSVDMDAVGALAGLAIMADVAQQIVLARHCLAIHSCTFHCQGQ